jgi:hypothetical protein
MAQLVRDAGYDLSNPNVSNGDITSHLRKNPDLVRIWVQYSEDQRSSPAWYLSGPGEGRERLQTWSVGYYCGDGGAPEVQFEDEFEACAFFIMRNLEQLAEGDRPGR